MSQKVVIERVTIRGAAVFTGLADNKDPDSERIYSRSGDRVMDWLCDGWRSRFNQHRSRRHTYDQAGRLVPIGRSVTELTDKQARLACSWLAAMPSYVLQSPGKVETTEWFAAVQRRTALRAKGRPPGRMPRFKRVRRDDQQLVCWFNGGRNATFEQVNSRHGIVRITGQNPSEYRQPGQPARFEVRIHVRVSQPIREYTSIRVNWTRRTLVFVNEPLAIEREQTGKAVGVDRGVVNQVATSDGEFADLPRQRLKSIDQQIRRLQRAQARAVAKAGYTNQRGYLRAGPSTRFQARRSEIARLSAKASRIVEDHQHKISHRLVVQHDLIVTEDLSLRSMLGTPAPRPDPLKPGAFLPNGRAAKRGLNRVLSSAAMAGLEDKLVYKSRLAGVSLIQVDARYTSQTCNQCGHTARESRESQAVFSCIWCGHTINADTNAALNILHRGLAARLVEHTQGGTHPGDQGPSDAVTGARSGDRARPTREPLTA